MAGDEPARWATARLAYMREIEPGSPAWPSVPVTVDPAEQVRNRQMLLDWDGRRDGRGMKRNGIGSHTLPNNGESDIWLTPPEIVGALGHFDLDPCAAPDPRPWPTATVHVVPPTDGLLIPWVGRVWLNPPYGDKVGDWLDKMGRHGCGIALTFARTETEAWQRSVWPFAKAVLFIAGRLYFRLPDGTRAAGNAGGPSALIAYSERDADVLAGSGIPGAIVRVERIWQRCHRALTPSP